MKKVGIMTMHRIVNYGSFLQAYGLKKLISSMECDVEFVDYEYERSLVERQKSNIFLKLWKCCHFFNYLNIRKKRKEFKDRYNNEFLKILGVGKEYNYNHDIDCLVIGSDEVFNCMQTFPVGYSRELFGYGYKDAISYAASFGYTNLELLNKYNIKDEVGEYIKNLQAISVRDENSKKIVEEITNITPLVHFDPVLISDYNNEIEKYHVQMKEYIIVYAYDGRLTNEEEKQIKKFAKKNNKKIVSIGFAQKIADYNLILNPFEVLAYFKNADFVITDTFHGTIFSIIMNTNFCTIIRDSNRNKLTSLLEYLGLSSRKIENINEVYYAYSNITNFNYCNEKRQQERKKSIKYLKENIVGGIE